MADQLKFFSQEWCDAAREAVNNNKEVYKGFKDPNSFTNKMEFRTIGGPASTLEWNEGQVASWSAGAIDASELAMILEGNLDTWQAAAAGNEQGGKLLMQGKIKFIKGPMSAAIENANALNNFLLSWGAVATDWNA
ncbi:SCP2 sterol-binding domain-containing protein [Mycolicibacterium gadium]|uniref:SCP2 sterol-binding domain-containing protein n=1 Tax=Mycolicibacterium gadium TaxID=1794 RepID=A0ABT6GZU6_MYCGU|nr:SCP2 sterol-binding domain-containing protein [Mycolicibacterium gadium]MDG5486722.1 SCP2 sterol-binding domain-containing protein [Mycolicibacterium gadium]